MVQASEEGGDTECLDIPQAMCLLNEMNNNVEQVNNLVTNMLVKVKNGELSTENGLSFLEVKFHMLLNYLINLTYVVLRKCSGETIEKDPAIYRLIEIRTVLEKTKQIDYKLRYQIDKLLKAATSGGTDSTDIMSFKPNPANLLKQNNADEDSTDDSDSESEVRNKVKKLREKKSIGLYVPPKLMAVSYDGEETREERAQKQLERAKKLAMNSSIIQDLKEEYLDTPIEVTSSTRAQQLYSREQREKEEYEETYLTRLPITKADKHKSKRMTTLGNLGSEITSFRDISALGGGELDLKKTKSNKRKRGISSKKGKGKKRKFR